MVTGRGGRQNREPAALRCDGSGIVLPRPRRADAMDIESLGMMIECVWRSKRGNDAGDRCTDLNDWRRNVEGVDRGHNCTGMSGHRLRRNSSMCNDAQAFACTGAGVAEECSYIAVGQPCCANWAEVLMKGIVRDDAKVEAIGDAVVQTSRTRRGVQRKYDYVEAM
eukprot:1268778-Pyramimonas_sp.AAC.1